MTQYSPEEILAARQMCSSNRETARQLGINESWVRKSLKKVKERCEDFDVEEDDIKERARRGELGYKVTLPGFEVAHTTEKTGPDGELQALYVTQKPERGETFEVPEGHSIKGISALLGPDGRITQQWIKTKEEAINQERLHDAIMASFEKYTGIFSPIPAPRTLKREDLLSLYNVGDHHFGVFAWGKETGGDNCDTDIGRRLLLDTARELIANAPDSKYAQIVSLGDFFHANGKIPQTDEHKNPLERDGRFEKVYELGVDLMIEMVQMALQRHEIVDVQIVKGNHDETSAFTLAIALKKAFQFEPRVTIGTSPSKVWVRSFGKVMLAATHGDKIRAASLSGYMAANFAKLWGDATFRYGYTGHRHFKEKITDEHNGATIETFQILPPQDEFNSKFPLNGRSMTCITHHKDRGEYLRHTANIIPGTYD